MTTPEAAVAWLRRRTLARATRSYVTWVGRAVGWWTVAYLIFWGVAIVGSGLQTAFAPALEPVGAPVAAIATAVVAALLAASAVRRRAPTLTLDRRDLMRLALAPVEPHAVLGYRTNLRRFTAALYGAVAGGMWSAFSAAWLHVPAPWAAPALALVAVAAVDVGWLAYARGAPIAGGLKAGGVAAGLAVAASLAALAPALGVVVGRDAWPWTVTSALVAQSPLSLLGPVVLALSASMAVRRSLREAWPPRFAAQSLVLAQLSGMRMLRALASVAGLDAGSQIEAGVRERLLAALYDRPGAARPVRSVPRPSAAGPLWRALAWRSASAFWRRPWRKQAWVVFRALVAAGVAVLSGAGIGSLVGAAGPSLGGSGAAADALGTTSQAATVAWGLGGPLGLLAAGFLVAQAAAGALGPPAPPRQVPLPAGARTWGRSCLPLVLLGFATIFAVFLMGALGVPDASSARAVVSAFATVVTATLVLERYSYWAGVGAARLEPQLVAALVAALPALLLQALGYPEWVSFGQLVVLAVALVVDV